MRSITLTVLARTLLSSDIGADAIDEIERLLRVLLSELVARGISANVPGLAWVPTRSNRRFSAANRRLRALLTESSRQGYRFEERDLVLKAYLRRPEDRALVERGLAEAGMGRAPILLRAEICRPELLLEIEGYARGEALG